MDPHEHSSKVQQQSTAARRLFGDAQGASMLLPRAHCPLATPPPVVRDEEAAGSNPVTRPVFPQVSGPHRNW